ncbi:MAG: sigma-70 family RNA polymerase sigma factor [Prevotellaceae bacterium]|nr:sigma-70 family RNA polymerase sigma factor [Candidatus Minthosoma caballi]
MTINSTNETARTLAKRFDEIERKTIPFLRHRYGQQLRDEELEDVFRDSCIVVYKNAKAGKLDKMTSTLSTYQTQICINLCNKMINRKKGLNVVPLTESADDLREERALSMDKVSQLSDAVSENECDDSEAVFLVREVLKKIGEKCKHILMGMYADHFKQEVIAAQLGYTSADAVKATAYRCKKRFKEMFTSSHH